MGKTVGVEMTQRTVITRTSWTVFPPRYLFPELRGAKPGYHITAGRDVVKYDELDIELLRMLSSPKIVTNAECARRLGEPVNTIRYRRSVLEAKGVVVCYVLGIDPVRLGRIPYLCVIQVKTPSAELRGKLHAFIAHEPDVSCLLSCIGAWDYEITVDVEKPEDVAAFQRRLFEKFPTDLVSVQTVGLLKTHKLEPFPSKYLD
jgi:DNA-binding Lrp family transcriptional regulator